MTRSEFLKMIGLGAVASAVARKAVAEPQTEFPVEYQPCQDFFGPSCVEISQTHEDQLDGDNPVFRGELGPIVQRRYGLMRGGKVYAQERVNNSPWSEPFEVPSERVGFRLDMMIP